MHGEPVADGEPCQLVAVQDVVARPRAELSQLCKFLDLDAPADYLDACAAALFAEPRRTRDLVPWPRELLTDVLWQCRTLPFLRRYRQDVTAPAEQSRAEPRMLRRAA